MKRILSVLIIFLPWSIRRLILIKIWNFEIHPSSRIGLSYIYPSKLRMLENSKIGSFNVAINLDEVILKKNATISRFNWITGFSTKNKTKHFMHQKHRSSKLLLGQDSAVTKHHHLDCTSEIRIGKFSIIAGYQSQFLSHSVDIISNRQHSEPILIGDYCFVGTNCVILGGSQLPNNSVLGAKSLLNKSFENKYTLYGGVPATDISKIPKESKFFTRKEGFVY